MEWLVWCGSHWPFVAVACVLSIVGDFFGRRVFTKPRAYQYRGKSVRGIALQEFWYWGRESLPLHPIAAGFFLGRVWIDPEGLGWGAVASMWYFALAGFTSLSVWVVLKAAAKKKGIVLHLPGESLTPPINTPSGSNGEDIPS